MGRFVNPDNSAFQVALNSKIYVDKTGLIEYTNSVLDTTDAYICNSRPRRFGKSYAANMLAAYYSKGADSEKMFSGLQISKEADFREHLNKYDVIHIDIQWFLANCEDVDNVVTLITDSVLSELREIYPDIFTWEVSRLPDALSIVREKTGQKFIIIIDEWDVLIRDAATNGKVQEACICEGAAETAIIDILLDYELLIFSREEMIEEEVIRCREGKKFEEKYLRKGFMDKISVIRILDSRRENFKLSKAYTGKVDVINVITAPEIEMLIIFNENKYKEFKKSGKKPSSFCKEDLKMTEVKSYDFVKMYFSDPRILVTAIKKYHEMSKVQKDEYTLLDLLR